MKRKVPEVLHVILDHWIGISTLICWQYDGAQSSHSRIERCIFGVAERSRGAGSRGAPGSARRLREAVRAAAATASGYSDRF